MDHNEYQTELILKFIVIGRSAVGKSCLLLRYAKSEFTPVHNPTIGVEFHSKKIFMNEASIKLQIWDTAGQQTFKSIVRNFYKGSDAVFIVYSIADRKSFQDVDEWYQQAKSNCSEDAVYVLIGSQKDLEQRREVQYEEGVKTMERLGMMLFFETSAKMDQNVDIAFQETAKRIMLVKIFSKKDELSETTTTIKLDQMQGQQKVESSCC